MPTIIVNWLPGRTEDQKAEVAKGITDVLVTAGNAPREGVTVIFNDLPEQNWAYGGVLYSQRKQQPKS